MFVFVVQHRNNTEGEVCFSKIILSISQTAFIKHDVLFHAVNQKVEVKSDDECLKGGKHGFCRI